MKNARTNTLKKYISNKNIRLSVSDREFLADLARVGIIAEDDAKEHHYSKHKSPVSRRLKNLCDSGVLEKVSVNQPAKGIFNAYQFKSDSVAKLFGGKRLSIGRKRNALHEVITSKLYFAEGRPDTFILESNFSKTQKKMFEVATPSLTGNNHVYPDAMYVKQNGEIVVVESDSGQYNQTQIRSKQAAWTSFTQVWGQPFKSSARVRDAVVYRFE